MSSSFRLPYLWIAAILIAVDQWTKIIVVNFLTLHQTLPVFPGLSLTLRHNTGAAFNFLALASGWQRWFFVVLAVAVSILIFFWLGRLKSQDYWEALGLSCILGGALGNLIDRLWHGYVIDFILVYYRHWEWPAFNIADSAICLGVLFFALSIFKKKTA